MIRTRLTLWNTLLFALALTLLGSLLFGVTRSGLYKAVDDDLARRASFLESRWGIWSKNGPDHDRDHGGPPRPPEMFTSAKDLDPIQAKRVEFNASLMRPRIMPMEQIRSGKTHDEPFDSAALKLSLSGQKRYTTQTIMDHQVRILSLPLLLDGKIDGAAQFASDLDDIDNAIQRIRNIMLVMVPLALLATYLLGVLLTNRALKPVRDITVAAQRIEASSLSERLPVKGKDEFANLSNRFNQMLERIETSYARLEQSYESQRRFVGDASHELKTPLTSIKGRVGLALMKTQTAERYEEHLHAIGRSADNMAAIIQDLLLLANSDEKQLALTLELVLFMEVAGEAVSAVIGGAERVDVKAPEDLTIHVDRKLFRQVLVNLLSNALRHSDEGSRVVLAADTDAISVIDFGEGIESSHLPHLFDRFYRVDESRFRGSGGSGLGLAIVKSIVEAHGGTVGITSELGWGTTVTIKVP